MEGPVEIFLENTFKRKRLAENELHFKAKLFMLLHAIYPQKKFREVASKLGLGLPHAYKIDKTIELTKREKIDELFQLAFEAQVVFFNEQTRIENGIYYTPAAGVRPMIRKMASRKIESICEPACGTGILTLIFLDEYLSNFKRAPIVKCFDLSPIAAELTKTFVHALIFLKTGEYSKPAGVEIISNDISNVPFENENFDILLMNPPYVKGAQKFIKQKHHDLMQFGSSNLTNVFMSYAFAKLKSNGSGLFILGEPVKWGNSYSGIVEKIHNEFTTMDYVHSLENFDSIQYEVFAISIKRNIGYKENKKTVGSKLGTLAINLSAKDNQTFQKILNSSKPLQDFMSVCTRGIYVKKNILKVGANFISSGTEMNAYVSQANYSVSKSGTGWKQIFDQKRIIIKAKRGKLLHAALAEAGIATTDNIVNFYPKNISMHVMLAYLNSAVVSYFLTEGIFCGNAESARILDGVYLEKLPFPKLSDIDKIKIEKFSKMIVSEVDSLSKSKHSIWHLEIGRDSQKIDSNLLSTKINICLREIDRILFRAFQIDEKTGSEISDRFGRLITSKNVQKKAA